VQRALRERKISAGHARVLVSVSDPDLQIALSEQIIARGMSVRAAEEYVRSVGETRSTKRSKKRVGLTLTDAESAQIRNLTNRIRSHYGTHVSIKHEPGKGGRIEIAYYSEEDLERVIELLLGLS